jgi:hypothetical protein
VILHGNREAVGAPICPPVTMGVEGSPGQHGTPVGVNRIGAEQGASSSGGVGIDQVQLMQSL